MSTLAIDIETYSSVDLAKCGVYKYCQSPDFEILLIAYSYNGSPTLVLDMYESSNLDSFFFDALIDPKIIKTAHNAAFERTALAAYLGLAMPAEQWDCTMALAAQCGLPLSLDAASKALGLDAKKDAAGKALIKYFTTPCKPTKANGGRTRNLPHHDPDRWAQFIEYCRQDVVVEQAIKTKLSWFKPTDTERRVWILDQKINDTGVLLDPVLAENAIYIDTEYRERLTAEAVALTGLDNPNSPAQLKKWLAEDDGDEVTSLSKDAVKEMLTGIPDGTRKRVLELRQRLSKSSVKKYTAMLNLYPRDGRARQLIQYGGASRTLRWAGRIVQPHNLPKNPEPADFPEFETLRRIVCEGDLDNLELTFGENVTQLLSWLIRTAFIAAPGSRFIPADYSAIEARVLSWLAQEQWRLDVFNTHGKIYEASAAQMFKVGLDTIRKDGPNYHLRAKGKVAELALGYQGGVGALIEMGALEMGLKESELSGIVYAWRKANPKIVDLWDLCDDAAIRAVRDRVTVKIRHGIVFKVEQGNLTVQLPSGRKLYYWKAFVAKNKFGLDCVSFYGQDSKTKSWGKRDLYGGLAVENLCQAIARDVLAEAMLRLDAAGYSIVLHVHDEVIPEMPYGQGSTEEVDQIMGQPIPWAAGLPLKAESYETEFYKKD